MVRKGGQYARIFANSYGTMVTIMNYIQIKDIVTMQGCNKKCYELWTPHYRPYWSWAQYKRYQWHMFRGIENVLKGQYLDTIDFKKAF